MKIRVRYAHVARAGYQSMLQMEEYTRTTTISPTLRELIKIRASQINGCAYCLDMHSQDARQAGERQQRIDCLSAWRDCPFYSEEERAALELTEAVTLITRNGVPEDLYERVRTHFDEKEYVDLVLLINQINNWNRISIATGQFPTERVEA